MSIAVGIRAVRARASALREQRALQARVREVARMKIRVVLDALDSGGNVADVMSVHDDFDDDMTQGVDLLRGAVARAQGKSVAAMRIEQALARIPGDDDLGPDAGLEDFLDGLARAMATIARLPLTDARRYWDALAEYRRSQKARGE